LIVLQGSRLRAKVAIDKGAVKVLPLAKGNADKRGGARQTPLRKNERAAVTITGDDEAIGRIVLGCTSPFEEQLQIEVETAPTGNPQTTQLLEILFPRLLRI